MPTRTQSPVTIALHYADTNTALQWLVDVLGIKVEWRYPEAGHIRHAALRWRGELLWLNEKAGSYAAMGPTSVLLDLATDDDLDGAWAKARDEEADVAAPLAINWDGESRNFTVRDPEGTLWQVGGPTVG